MSRVKTVWMAALLVLLWGPAQAEVSGGDKTAITEVIRAQMAAFKRDAAEEAFSFAAPAIRAQFGTAERFMTMERNGYRPVYRPRAVRMGETRDYNSTIVQEVFVIGPASVSYLALYPVERQPDGTWKIAGCYLSKRAEKAI